MKKTILNLALTGLVSSQALPNNAFLDPTTLFLLTNNGGSSDISLLMMMQNANFGSDYGINPLLLTSLLDDNDENSTDDNKMDTKQLTRLILLSGMSAQYPNNDFSSLLPMLMMNNGENMSPLLFAAFSSRFAGQNGGSSQWALMEHFARQRRYENNFCLANLPSGQKECRCKSRFADFQAFMPQTDDGFFSLASLLDEVKCTTPDNEDCYCCYQAKTQRDLIMEFFLMPQQENKNMANVWVDLFKHRQDNKCHQVEDDNGDTCYCKMDRMPMMNDNPMYAYFFNSHTCKHDDGSVCKDEFCQTCQDLGQDMSSILPFLLTGNGFGSNDPTQVTNNFMNMQQLFPFLLEDTECLVNGDIDTCTCKDKTDQMMSLMMMSSNNNYGMNPMMSMMLMNDKNTCQGKTADGNDCTCEKSNDKLPLLMMLSQNNGATNLVNSPAARAGNFNAAYMLHSSDPASKAAMNELFNHGLRMHDPNFNRAFMLVRNGLPVGIAKMLTSSGPGNDPTDQEAMVNMMVASGFASVENAPLMTERFFNVDLDGGDARSFFISQLLDQDKIDPFIGFLMLARADGQTSTEIRNVFKSINYGNNNLLTNWAKGFQYVPADLPRNVYPGAKLKFAHMEDLGVDTCSIISPDLRMECGYRGITAEQCEQKPYCCFSPILSGEKAFDDTPWCYYNIYGCGGCKNVCFRLRQICFDDNRST